MPVRTRASLQELSAIAGKAELVDGEVVEMAPTGDAPGTAADEIYFSLRKYVETTGAGHAVSDNKAFRVNLPHRQTVSPDAAYYTGPRSGMKFYPVAPVFAAEVRSENDYGLPAEQELARKRADYIAAGTLVVWDVDLLNEPAVRKYTAADPEHPAEFRRGQTADAEPAVPGWRMAVDDLFR
ncbi:MAG TPA: Uma2 family endonuclease [Tepidisphaeraceae bacterium]|nr:Uma2 family endonuclease [Tepidisphaeraceae bacterium]